MNVFLGNVELQLTEQIRSMVSPESYAVVIEYRRLGSPEWEADVTIELSTISYDHVHPDACEVDAKLTRRLGFDGEYGWWVDQQSATYTSGGAFGFRQAVDNLAKLVEENDHWIGVQAVDDLGFLADPDARAQLAHACWEAINRACDELHRLAMEEGEYRLPR